MRLLFVFHCYNDEWTDAGHCGATSYIDTRRRSVRRSVARSVRTDGRTHGRTDIGPTLRGFITHARPPSRPVPSTRGSDRRPVAVGRVTGSPGHDPARISPDGSSYRPACDGRTSCVACHSSSVLHTARPQRPLSTASRIHGGDWTLARARQISSRIRA